MEAKNVDFYSGLNAATPFRNPQKASLIYTRITVGMLDHKSRCCKGCIFICCIKLKTQNTIKSKYSLEI